MVLIMKNSIATNLAIEGFDPVKYLIDEDSINAYLTDIKRANDPVLIKLAMQNVEQARLINSNKK